MTKNKKNLKTKIISLCLLVALIAIMMPVGVFAFESDDSILKGTCGESATYTYDESTKVLTISGTGKISNSAFSCYNADDSVRKNISADVKTVIINEGITEIGTLAFDCCKCTSIELPDSLEIIRNSAFYCCYITSIDIPDTVTTIERAAFNSCQSLVNVKLPANIEVINELTFSGCSKLEKIDIPLSVEKIGKDAFSNCCSSSLELNIPCNVELEFNSRGILGSMGYANSFCGIVNVVPDSNQEKYFLNNYGSEISAEKIALNTILSHNFSSCVENEDGTYVETCSICGEEKLVECHRLVKVGGRDATCLEDGIKEYWYCDICHRCFEDEKAAVEIVEDIDTWKVIHAGGHRYHWYHTGSMGNNAYDLLCSECNENFGRSYLSSDNLYYRYGYVENGDYYHYIYNENAECLGSGKCKVEYWNSDESCHEGICKCHIILSADDTHSYKAIVESKATTDTNGKKIYKCDICGAIDVKAERVIYKISSIKLSATENTYDGSKKTPSVTVKDSKGNKLVEGKDYNLAYSSSTRTSIGRYSVNVTFMGDYSGSKTLYFTIGPKSISSVKTTLYGYDDVKVSWSKVSGATGYKVYYKENTSTTWLSKTTTGGSVKLANLSDGVKYDIKVVAYKLKDGYKCYNEGKLTSIYTLKKVTGVKAAKSGTKLKVSWKNISGETGYQISKSTKKSGTNIVTTYKTTSGKSKIISVVKGKTYYYKVRAYKVEDGKKNLWTMVNHCEVC